MQLRRIVSLVAAATVVLAVPTTASANYRVGLSEQNPAVFSQPAWQSLGLKRTRYIVPWDYAKHADEVGGVNAFMTTAHAAKQDVLIAFTAPSGCYLNGKYSKSSACKAPTPSKYHSAFLAFKRAYPWVKTYAPWNEENHVSQPTHSSPKRAAEYYDVVRKACKGCTVLAADVLDASNVRSWLK